LQVPSLEVAMREGAKFKLGSSMVGGKRINIPEMGIFNDGITVGTFHTDDSEHVLEDATEWARRTFGLREPVTHKPRIFDSHVVVEFESSIDDALTAFSKIKGEIGSAMEGTYNKSFNVGIQRLDFGIPISDPNQVPRGGLLIERRIGYPFDSNRFYSLAPLRTEIHLELLQSLEGALANLARAPQSEGARRSRRG
jgi:hypothetical protein